MRDAIGGTWLFNIVIFFVILFTGYMALSINHTKAFNVKDDIVKIIEREDGFDNLNNINSTKDKEIISQIAGSLQNMGYRTSSSCPSADGGPVWYGFDREGNKDASGHKSSFCIREINATTSPNMPKIVYYQVVVFYQLDLPIFNSLFGFTVKGDTKLIYS